MKKSVIFICGVVSGIFLIMLYLHRRVIAAAIKGEELPKAPVGCPAYKKEG